MFKRSPAFAGVAMVVVAGSLLGCARLSDSLSTGKLATVLAAPAAKSLLSQIETGFAGPAKGVINKVRAGIRVVETDRKYICAAASMADGLFKLVADVGLVSVGDVGTEASAMVGVDAACSPQVTDLVSAVGAVGKTYAATMNVLKDAGVPVTVPVAGGS